jgi:hypothetical protein
LPRPANGAATGRAVSELGRQEFARICLRAPIAIERADRLATAHDGVNRRAASRHDSNPRPEHGSPAMANIEVECPKCYRKFFADEFIAMIRPECGHIIKK